MAHTATTTPSNYNGWTIVTPDEGSIQVRATSFLLLAIDGFCSGCGSNDNLYLLSTWGDDWDTCHNCLVAGHTSPDHVDEYVAPQA